MIKPASESNESNPLEASKTPINAITDAAASFIEL